MKNKILPLLLFAPATGVGTTLAMRLREQEKAMQRALAKIRLPLIWESEAVRDFAKKWGEQEKAMQRALAKIRLPLIWESEAVRDFAKKWGEQEKATQRALAKIRLPLIWESEAVRDFAKKWSEQEAATRQAMEEWRLSILSVTDAGKPYLEEFRRQERVSQQVLGTMQLQGTATNTDSPNFSLTFDASFQSGDAQIVCRYGGQKIAIAASRKVACGAYVRGHVLCFIDIVRENLCSFIEETMCESVGRDWEKRIPRKVRDRCERDRNRHASAASTPNSLLVYATFNGLSDLICLDANWDQVFQRIFLERETVKGSLFWINKIRNSAAHGHPVSKGDLQRLFVEAKYILGTLKKLEK